MKDLAGNIRQIRKSKLLTQKEMANKLGTYQAIVQKLETGQTDITWARLNKIADIFQMSVINYPNGEDSNKKELERLSKENKELKEKKQMLIRLNELLEDKVKHR